MTVSEVATAKGVSEAAIRFAVCDPQNQSLQGIKCAGRLMILASSVQTYTSRNYLRMQEFIKSVGTDRQQERILGILAELAIAMVEEHPIAARILRSTFPDNNTLVNGRTGYSLLLVMPDDLHSTGRTSSTATEVIFSSDSRRTVERKAQQWARRLVEESLVE